MKLEFNREQLLELMKDFHILTGIRIVLFDDEYQELLSYPQGDCRFCSLVKSHPATRGLCARSDQHSFAQCRAEKKLILYHCHAGLIEASVPLVDNHIVIGYLMFGQISDASSCQELARILSETVPEQCSSLAEEIPRKTKEEIQAAAKIMEACTFYALLNESVSLRRQDFTNRLRLLLLEHLPENLDAGTVAELMGVSRSSLYHSCEQYLGTGIAKYVRTLRLETARKLLRKSDLTVTEIAERVGFADYNYFCRVFKKETGYSARKYRSLHT